MGHKYFTVSEAENILPKVRHHMTRLMSVHDELNALSGVKVHANSFDWTVELLAININKRFHELSFKYYAELESLTKLGCKVKDVEQGVVDFYTRLGERDLLLCWQYDEPKILFYHDKQTGYPGRRPVSELKTKLNQELQSLR